jgi:hypothetical protein
LAAIPYDAHNQETVSQWNWDISYLKEMNRELKNVVFDFPAVSVVTDPSNRSSLLIIAPFLPEVN